MDGSHSNIWGISKIFSICKYLSLSSKKSQESNCDRFVYYTLLQWAPCGFQYDAEHLVFFVNYLQILLICSSNFSSESKVIPSNFSLGLDTIDAFAKQISLCVFELKIQDVFQDQLSYYYFYTNQKNFQQFFEAQKLQIIYLVHRNREQCHQRSYLCYHPHIREQGQSDHY